MNDQKRYRVIACGVFRREIDAIRAEIPPSILLDILWLELGLHRNPHRLNALIREEIDRLDSSGEPYDAVLLAYGLCSHGITGISSACYPLVIARAHDCITLFLGSKERYQEEFSHSPGTYWFTPGFISGSLQPGRSEKYAGVFHEYEEQYRTYLERFDDPDIARYIIDNQEQAWIANYTRGAYISSGLSGDDELRQKAREYCAHRNWMFTEVPGDLSLIRDLLAGNWDNERFLVVDPGRTITAGDSAAIITTGTVRNDPVYGETCRESFIFDGEYQPCSPTEAAKYAGNTDIVIGIDAGGTYTDAVVISLKDRHILATAKSPTTYHDLSLGIGRALEQLPEGVRSPARRLALSTTLATNSIVEEKGSRTGLILIGYPPETAAMVVVGAGDLKTVVTGSYDIDGEEIEALDEELLLVTASSFIDEGIEALAVSSYMAVRNPDHEERAVALLGEKFTVPIVAGHRLTSDIDAVRRAHTALLNARLTPVIERLVSAMETIAARMGLPGDIRLVTTEASLMNTHEARIAPVRMILSGPAASVMGVRFLCGMESAVMVDMGGTTTDIAVIENGSARRTGRGAVIGNYRTSISATNIRTIGLGGDSWIRWIGKKVQVGPKRVFPISMLAQQTPAVATRLDELKSHNGMDYGLVQPGIFYLLLREPDTRSFLSEQERRALDIIAEGPVSEVDLARRLDYPYFSLLGMERLEELGIVIRSGLTPTDVLVWQKRIGFGDRETAHRMLELYAARAAMSMDAFIDTVWREIHTMTAAGIITEALGTADHETVFPGCHFCEQTFTAGSMVAVNYRLRVPLVGIGAPARLMLERLGGWLDGDMSFPSHGEVANAIGAAAATGGTHIDLLIMAGDKGGYVLYAPSGRSLFRTLDAAKAEAIDIARREALTYTRSMGYEKFSLDIMVTDRTVPTAFDTTIYLDTSLVASLKY
jgi:N-methylhydantoinase A/oxoprolinase/acetone carboxylase beta subunit